MGEKPLPHLVLLDVLMPEVSGFDVLNRIRKHPALQRIPVLLLTALADRKDVARGLTLGADGYITKPVLPSVLLKAVEAAVGRRQVAPRPGLEPGTCGLTVRRSTN